MSDDSSRIAPDGLTEVLVTKEAQLAAGRALGAMAIAVSKPLDDCWLMAGSGAAFALLVAKPDLFIGGKPGAVVAWAIGGLLASFVAGIGQKLFAAQTAMFIALLNEETEQQETAHRLRFDMTFRIAYAAEVRRGMVPLVRDEWDRKPPRLIPGDPIEGHRIAAASTQRQFFAAIAQVVLVVVAAVLMAVVATGRFGI